MSSKKMISRMTRRVLMKSARISSSLNFLTLSNILCKSSQLFGHSIQPYLLIAENYLKEHRYSEAVLMYKKAISFQPTLSTVYSFGSNLAIKGNLNDDFYRAMLEVIEIREIRSMIESLSRSPHVYQPSKLWLYFLVFNTFQIESGGIKNFKRTVNHNYFNWTGDSDVNAQYQAVKKALGWSDADLSNAEKFTHFHIAEKPIEFSESKWKTYVQYLCMLWEYAKKNDNLKLMDHQQEPILGNPLTIEYKGNKVTQDMCNTVMEVNTIMKVINHGPKEKMKVMELGAGHGRIGNVLLTYFPNIQVVIIDIPPALFVSQWYLSNLFPEKKIFKFREFSNYAEIRDEFESSSIVFLLPPQIEYIQDKYFDLFINVCSLQEMTLRQVEMWFGQIDRVCKGWFYTKQYLESRNFYDNITILQSDYPERANWEKVMNHTSPVFPELFETVYKID